MARHGDSKRVLLTAYADTEAAIRAINEIKLHHYLLKPWDPPEQNLYPVLDDLLDDWRSAFRPPFEGIRLMGSRWSPQSYELREFLAENTCPTSGSMWTLPPAIPRCGAWWSRAKAGCQFPVVMLPDGALLHSRFRPNWPIASVCARTPIRSSTTW